MTHRGKSKLDDPTSARIIPGFNAVPCPEEVFIMGLVVMRPEAVEKDTSTPFLFFRSSSKLLILRWWYESSTAANQHFNSFYHLGITAGRLCKRRPSTPARSRVENGNECRQPFDQELD
jgi:hypothetical protein